MNIEMWLRKYTRLLVESDIPTARLDCLVILEDITGKERGWLLAHSDFELSTTQLRSLSKRIQRRAVHEPLAYIREKTEFYGRTFKVTPDTLEPRPETETMIELFRQLPESKQNCLVADIGTGCGAIGITVALERPQTSVFATDISKEALMVAKHNVNAHNAPVKFAHGNLLEPLKTTPDIILANLPYVPSNHTINNAAMHEPHIAIFGGADGLDLYRELFGAISRRSKKPTVVLTESLPPQHELLKTIAAHHGYTLVETDDFIQQFRSTA